MKKYEVEGSPPHVRGLLGKGPQLAGDLRITPACAGTTLMTSSNSSMASDHPRMCGDYGEDYSNGLTVSGSPPHVRGLRADIHVVVAHRGITPACAGTTPFLPLFQKAKEDHPRMCGDYAFPSIL